MSERSEPVEGGVREWIGREAMVMAASIIETLERGLSPEEREEHKARWRVAEELAELGKRTRDKMGLHLSDQSVRLLAHVTLMVYKHLLMYAALAAEERSKEEEGIADVVAASFDGELLIKISTYLTATKLVAEHLELLKRHEKPGESWMGIL